MMSVITWKNENCDLNGVRVAKHRNSPSECGSSTVTRQSQFGIIDKAFRHRRCPERGKMRTILYFSAFLFWSHIFISRSLDRKICFFLIVFFLFVPHSRSATPILVSIQLSWKWDSPCLDWFPLSATFTIQPATRTDCCREGWKRLDLGQKRKASLNRKWHRCPPVAVSRYRGREKTRRLERSINQISR